MVEKFKELVRPAVTVLFAAAVVYFTLIKILPIEAFVGLATAAIVWWYKDRSEKKINGQEYIINVPEEEKK